MSEEQKTIPEAGSAGWWREEFGKEPPNDMGPVTLDEAGAARLLAALNWHENGYRHCTKQETYAYFDDLEEVASKIDVEIRHFIHGNGSTEQGGGGWKIVMRPKEGVSPEDLPETALDEDG